ncbi:hypothetical protein ACFYO0_24125 [Streptomyces sp. NPDC006365]|uniref:hypothetical protein n=1 Tax=Streptomyces sp. NPDC006365 TaxID=3364744 RepID=UPI00368ECF31
MVEIDTPGGLLVSTREIVQGFLSRRCRVLEGTSLSDRQALRDNVVDLVAPSRSSLLDDVDGRTVVVGPQDAAREVELRTADARVVEHDLGFFGELRQWLASPELAFLFLSIGMLAVLYELAAPGIGVVGGILLVLGFVALCVPSTASAW